MVCTTWKKLPLAALAVMLLAACGGTEREPSEDSRHDLEARDGDERLSASAVCSFDIYAQSMYVARDQRTRTANYEGDLELTGLFTVDGAFSALYPSSGYSKVAQGGNVVMNTRISSVSISGTGTTDLQADLWENEFGFGGATDHGWASSAINLDCTQSQIDLMVPVSIGGNTVLETTAQVNVTFRAIKRTGWTAWLNRDLPSGNGDYELLADFPPEQTCSNPVAIECQTTSGIDWTQTGEVYTCDFSVGGYCRNADQPDGACQDYQVRFLCP